MPAELHRPGSTKAARLVMAAALAAASSLAQAQTQGVVAQMVSASSTEEPTLPQLCSSARRGDVESIYRLAWVYAYGKGAERNEAYASYLFFSASSAGHDGAKRMMANMSWPAAEIPRCMQDTAENRYVPHGAVVAVDAPAEIARLVDRLAPRYQLDPKLVLAIIAVESNFDKFALSPKNAMGLMQLMPKTADRFKVNKPFDVADNIRGGMAYLRWLLAYFQGDLVLVAAAYNAGEGAVEKHRGVPPFAETQDYVRKVLERVGVVQHPFDAKATEPSPALKLMNKSAQTP